MAGKRPCAYGASSHHSADRVTVYHGAPVPVTLCGYHASVGWLAVALAYVASLSTKGAHRG